MKRFVLTIQLLLSTSAFAQEAPGLMTRDIAAPHHNSKMQMAIWYPATAGTLERFAENPVFVGGDVRRNAAIASGKHPVVLMSHGMSGTYLSLNWLATGLAQKGAIVVSVNHPNGWFGDRKPDKMFDHWTRVQDLQVALDAILGDKTLAANIDPARIYATGFSFGGWTTLSLAGVTSQPEGNFDFCNRDGSSERFSPCTDLKNYGFNPTKTDRAKWSASYKDSRIASFVAIEPGLTWSLDADDVKALDQSKMLIIELGAGNDRHFATDTSSSGSNFESLVPNVQVEVIAPATHFTAMPVCSTNGVKILADEKDDPVCTDPAGTDRKAVHEKIIALAAEHFGLK
jgi:predicted dienelactone hydrolase